MTFDEWWGPRSSLFGGSVQNRMAAKTAWEAAVAAERERCLKIARKHGADEPMTYGDNGPSTARIIASEIEKEPT